MSRRFAAWLAWSMCAVCLSLMACSLLLIVLGRSTSLPRGWTPWIQHAVFLLGVIGAPVLGGLISARRPENPYGWLWLGLGLSFALMVLAEPYAAYALVVDPGSLPAPRMVVVLGNYGFGLAILLMPFLLLRFPDGRLPSRRWRFLAWIVVAVGAVMLIVAGFLPQSGSAPVENPFGLSGTVGEAIRLLFFWGAYVLFCAIVLSALSLVFRFRRAAGVERQQL